MFKTGFSNNYNKGQMKRSESMTRIGEDATQPKLENRPYISIWLSSPNQIMDGVLLVSVLPP